MPKRRYPFRVAYKMVPIQLIFCSAGIRKKLARKPLWLELVSAQLRLRQALSMGLSSLEPSSLKLLLFRVFRGEKSQSRASFLSTDGANVDKHFDLLFARTAFTAFPLIDGRAGYANQLSILRSGQAKPTSMRLHRLWRKPDWFFGLRAGDSLSLLVFQKRDSLLSGDKIALDFRNVAPLLRYGLLQLVDICAKGFLRLPTNLVTK